MTLTLDFPGQIFNSHILGMGRSIDLEWKRCVLDTMLDAQWACSWAMVHGKQIASFQPIGPWMGYSFTDLGAEGCCHSLNALFYIDTIKVTEILSIILHWHWFLKSYFIFPWSGGQRESIWSTGCVAGLGSWAQCASDRNRATHQVTDGDPQPRLQAGEL